MKFFGITGRNAQKWDNPAKNYTFGHPIVVKHKTPKATWSNCPYGQQAPVSPTRVIYIGTLLRIVLSREIIDLKFNISTTSISYLTSKRFHILYWQAFFKQNPRETRNIFFSDRSHIILDAQPSFPRPRDYSFWFEHVPTIRMLGKI